MPNPMFGIAAACRLDITPGSSSYAAYFALVAQYQFGTPIIHGRAPAELASSIGVPLYEGTGDPGIQASVPGVVVVSFPYPTASVEVAGVGYPVSSSTPSGTLVGVNWVDGNGVVHPDVDWEWQISVEPYLQGASPGAYNQEIVAYTGDGTANRLIPTTLDLTQGKVVVWIFGGVGTTKDISCFRHNDAGMPGTAVMGSTSLDTTHGIMSFGATGFTVTDGSIVGVHFANKLNTKYRAVVMQDTTTDNRYLRIGSYTGLGSFGFGATVQAASPVVTGSGFDPNWSGIVVTDVSGSYVWATISPTSGGLSAPYQGASGGTTFTTSNDTRTVFVSGKQTALTHVWIWGGNGVYRSSDFTGDSSVALPLAAHAVTKMIEALGKASFQVGTNSDVNQNARAYYYAALAVDAPLQAKNLFASFKGTGTASPPAVISGLGFTPGIAVARQYTTAAAGAAWRGADHTGTDSDYCDGSGDIATQGVVALGAGSVSIGSTIGPNGVDFYGWAWVGGAWVIPGTFAPYPPPAPPYVPPGTPPPGVPMPPGAGPGPGTFGCTPVVAAGAGNSGGSGCSTAVAAGTSSDAGSLGGAT